jgi:hypothetical protein
MELFTPEIFDMVYFLFKQTCPHALLSEHDYFRNKYEQYIKYCIFLLIQLDLYIVRKAGGPEITIIVWIKSTKPSYA